MTHQENIENRFKYLMLFCRISNFLFGTKYNLPQLMLLRNMYIRYKKVSNQKFYMNRAVANNVLIYLNCKTNGYYIIIKDDEYYHRETNIRATSEEIIEKINEFNKAFPLKLKISAILHEPGGVRIEIRPLEESIRSLPISQQNDYYAEVDGLLSLKGYN